MNKMIEIGLVIGVVMAIGKWLKTQEWYPNSYIPVAVVFLTVGFNIVNAFLFGSVELLDAGKLAFIEICGAIGIHSATKNTLEGRK
jgi:hypothetical protein